MRITDDLLFAHAAEAADIWLGSLPSNEDLPEMKCSKSFERKMHRLIKEQRRSPKANKILRYLKRSVAAVLVVAMLSFGGIMTVEAYRARVIEIVVQVFNELTEYRFSSEVNHGENAVPPDITFGFIPDGMEEIENRITSTKRRYVMYEDEAGRFFELTQRLIGNSGEYQTILDTEESDYEVIDIGGNEAFYNKKGQDCSIVWTDAEVLYRIYGNIEPSDLKEIAEKIKILEN